MPGKKRNSLGRYGAILVVFLSHASWADVETKKSVIKETATHIWQDQRRILTAPLRTNKTDLIIWGGAAASLLILAPEWNGSRSYDERFEQNINRNGRFTRGFLKNITHAGDSHVLIGTSLAMYGIGYWQDEPRFATASLHIFEGLIDTGIAIYLVKAVAGRSRPVDRPVDGDFNGPLGFFSSSNNDSFPSGHSAMSFAAATIFAHETKNVWLGYSAYAMAATVSYSRVYVEKHWASDVIAGAVLGYSVGVLVEKHRHAKEDKSARIIPTIQQDSVGLAWVKQW
jgi:membrane-associated phospholipid phosphatase